MKLIMILFTGLVLFSALYSPQVVYPVLMDHFEISTTQVALLQTATFIPLTLSPIFYGMIIDRLSPLFVLRTALFFLACGEAAFALSSSFEVLLGARFLQGLFIPAGMTAVVSYISTSYETTKIQKYIAYYMASTMAGGVAGRIIAGFFSTLYGWRISFMVLGCLIFAAFLLSLIIKNRHLSKQSKSSADISQIIRNKEYLKPILTVFFAFIVFSSIMNYYSIRIKELSSGINEFLIGTAYIGSLFGSVTAYMTPYFAKTFGSYKRTIAIALSAMLSALLLFSYPSVLTTIATLFLFCGAFIVVHTSCSGLLNKHTKSSKGALNGVYFTIYYLGGVIGSYFPGYIYQHFGWHYFLIFLMCFIMLGLLFSARIRLETE